MLTNFRSKNNITMLGVPTKSEDRSEGAPLQIEGGQTIQEQLKCGLKWLEDSRPLWNKRIKEKYAHGACSLAHLYAEQKEDKCPQAIEWHLKAIEEGNAHSLLDYAFLLLDGKSEEEPADAATKALSSLLTYIDSKPRDCEEQDIERITDIAFGCYEEVKTSKHPLIEIPKNYEHAFLLAKFGTDHHNARAMRLLARMHIEGKGTEKNTAEAERILEDVAPTDAGASLDLGVLKHMHAKPDEAARCFEQAYAMSIDEEELDIALIACLKRAWIALERFEWIMTKHEEKTAIIAEAKKWLLGAHNWYMETEQDLLDVLQQEITPEIMDNMNKLVISQPDDAELKYLYGWFMLRKPKRTTEEDIRATDYLHQAADQGMASATRVCMHLDLQNMTSENRFLVITSCYEKIMKCDKPELSSTLIDTLQLYAQKRFDMSAYAFLVSAALKKHLPMLEKVISSVPFYHNALQTKENVIKLMNDLDVYKPLADCAESGNKQAMWFLVCAHEQSADTEKDHARIVDLSYAVEYLLMLSELEAKESGNPCRAKMHAANVYRNIAREYWETGEEDWAIKTLEDADNIIDDTGIKIQRAIFKVMQNSGNLKKDISFLSECIKDDRCLTDKQCIDIARLLAKYYYGQMELDKTNQFLRIAARHGATDTEFPIEVYTALHKYLKEMDRVEHGQKELEYHQKIAEAYDRELITFEEACQEAEKQKDPRQRVLGLAFFAFTAVDHKEFAGVFRLFLDNPFLFEIMQQYKSKGIDRNTALLAFAYVVKTCLMIKDAQMLEPCSADTHFGRDAKTKIKSFLLANKDLIF